MTDHNEPIGEDDSPESRIPDETYASDTPSTAVSFGRWLLELVVLVGLAFALATGIKTFIVQPFVIPTGSMEHTIDIQDRVLVNKFLYRFGEPQVGDIVVFKAWRPAQPDLIKRIVATEGQTIDYMDDAFTIDGVPIEEPYIEAENRITTPGAMLPFTVPEGMVWVMGDNRNNSGDSRFNGPVAVEDVVGKAFFTYWPLDRIGQLR